MIEFHKKRALLNIRGIKFDVLLRSLDRLPQSRLGKLKILIETGKLNDNYENMDFEESVLSLCDDYNPISNEFYFDRDPHIFNLILNYYSNGKMHVDHSSCFILINNELEYWQINDSVIDSCCDWKFYYEKDEIKNEIAKREEIIKHILHKDKFDNFIMPKIREKIFNIVEKPSSSIYSRIFFGISVVVILLYSAISIISTLPELKFDPDSIFDTFAENELDINSTTLNITIDVFSRIKTVNYVFGKMQLASAIWFLFETLMRFFSAPSFLNFLKSPLNLIDIISTFFGIIYYLINNIDKSVLNFISIIRIILLIRLVRHFKSLQILIYVFKKSIKEIAALFLYLIMGVIIFSSFMYLFEQMFTKNSKFTSIPSSFWWAIATMTTVGYGDLVPVSVAGKLIAGVCAVSGILLVPLPMAILATNFSDFYHNERRKKEIITKYSSKFPSFKF